MIQYFFYEYVYLKYCKRIYFYETYFLIFHCSCTNLKENKNKVVELRYKTKSICGPVVQSLNIKTPNFHHYLKKCSIVRNILFIYPCHSYQS